MTNPNNKPATEEWEERFEDETMLIAFGFGDAQQQRLKSFITETVREERKKAISEVIDVVEGLRPKSISSTDNGALGQALVIDGYNAAIDQVQKTLKQRFLKD